MKNKIILLALLLISSSLIHVKAQQAVAQNKTYEGAVPKEKVYKAIYQMDNASPEIIAKTIRNINNLLKDPWLIGKVEVELVAFSGGTEAYRKGGPYEEAIKELVEKGVLVVQCLNTLQERKIDKSELVDFLAYVPTGNGELLIRASDGWTIIKP